MRIVRFHDEHGQPVYIHCQRVMYFRENNEGPHTLTDIHMTNGVTIIKVKESLSGVRETLAS